MADELNQENWTKILNGNENVWREFLNSQIPQLYRMFMNHWPNPSLAEELVQKTVFDAIRARATYQPSKGSPQEWIFGIARNNIRLEIRKRAARPSADGDISSYIDTLDTKPLPDEILEQKETTAIVQTALNRLPAKEQAVLRAKYLEGLSANEIALQMNTTEKAVHDLLYRARLSLRQELKRIAPDR